MFIKKIFNFTNCLAIIFIVHDYLHLKTVQGFTIEFLQETFYIVDPYQLPRSQKLENLEDIRDCNCPRAYWPACDTENVTYVNACILKCLNKKLRRTGPCINYRRSNRPFIKLAIPAAWRHSPVDFNNTKKDNFNNTKYNNTKYNNSSNNSTQ